MTLDEAMELGREIHRDPRAQLIAIGRFKPPEELANASPWGCSIRFGENNCICWTRSAWIKVAESLPARIDPLVKPPRLDIKHIHQPTLF